MGVSKHLIGKIKRRVQDVKKDMEGIQSAHENKATLNRTIVSRIKNRGNRYSREFSKDKDRMIDLIEEQEKDLKTVLRDLEHIEHLLDLIINTEQISLLIDQRKRYGGVSELVDPINEPLENFRTEIDEVKVIRDGFEVLKVELEKQKEYVKHFDLDADDIDEEYFRKSEEYEAALSNQELISLTHLTGFCDALESQLKGRLRSERKVGSDDVTQHMLATLKKVKLDRGLFASNVRGFLEGYVRDVIGEKAFSRTFVLSLVFLLSRLEYFEKKRYEHSVLLAQLAYRTAGAAGFEADQRDAIVLAAIAWDIDEFDSGVAEDESIDASERNVLNQYYDLVKRTFISRIPFLDTIRTEAAKPTEAQIVTWPQQAGRFLAALDHALETIDERGASEKKVAHAFTRIMKVPDGHAMAKAVLAAHASLVEHD